MTRPAFLSPAPQFYPDVCIVCGLGNGGGRKYFIDLGFEINQIFQPLREGSVYLCNECWAGKMEEIQRLVNAWDMEHKPYQGQDVVETGYSWQQHIDVGSISGRPGNYSTASGAEPTSSPDGTEPDVEFGTDESTSEPTIQLEFG